MSANWKERKNQETRSPTGRKKKRHVGRNEETGPVFSQTRSINRLTEPFVFSMAIREPYSVHRIINSKRNHWPYQQE
ncbi:hypothetical protein C4565_01465 [Candidatus Parcubacteria bacterium]|nr:MAG: hypothetical protein C4565_01465 [Candidatus Parcubacteria bacterium]